MTANKRKSGKNTKGVDDVQKKDVFNTFIAWYCLPAFLRGMPDEKLKLYGFGDQIFDILHIKNQGEFQKAFNVGHASLARWKKRDDFKEQVNLFRKNFVFSTYKDAIDHKFSQRVIRTAEPNAVKLWHELYGDFIPKQEIVGHVQHTHVHVTDDISKKTILELVIAKVAARGGVPVTQLLKQVEDSYYAPLIDAEATVLESVPLPSSKPYDAEVLEQKVMERTSKKKESVEDKTRAAFAEKMEKLKAMAEAEKPSKNGSSEKGGGDMMDYILGN